MKKYLITSGNLNNSLAFYHAFFDRMPVELNEQKMLFRTEDFFLEVSEADHIHESTLTYQVHDEVKLASIHQRMNRFIRLGKLNNNCEYLGTSFGLVDPDGNRWKVGDPSEEVHYNKCYFN